MQAGLHPSRLINGVILPRTVPLRSIEEDLDFACPLQPLAAVVS